MSRLRRYALLVLLFPLLAQADDAGDFLLAVGNGDVGRVRAYLRQGMDANAMDAGGNTALIIASRETDQPDIVADLIAAGAKTYARNRYGETALMLAAFNGRARVVDLLLLKGTDGSANRGGWTPLLYAAYAGHTRVAEQLIRAGVDLNQANSSGMTALMLAARHGHFDTVKLLVSRGAETDRKTTLGADAVDYALESGNTHIARFIREKRAEKARN